jgi:type I restriction enzyme S subunit
MRPHCGRNWQKAVRLMGKWQMVSMADVLFFQEGPGVRNTQYTTAGVKLLNVANLQDGKVDLSTSDRYISEEEAYGKYKHFLVDAGDLIIASSGIQVSYFEKKMGFIASSQLPLCMNTSTIRFKSLDSNRLFIKFFMYYLKTIQFKEQLSKLITGTAQLNFGPSHIKQMCIPLPPLSVQQKIADILERVSVLIEKRKEQIKKLDLLVKSRFVTSDSQKLGVSM